jgi:branched-chain amino acid transport system ATP-binding protein
MTASILELDGVSKRFGGISVIENLNFAVSARTCVGLIGPNGAGKTTVFNLITGLFPLDAGRILLDGIDIARLPPHRRIRHGVARNFQNIRLMQHLSALDNVLVGQHHRHRGLSGILQPVNLWPRNRWREEARAALADAGLGDCERAAVGSLPYGIQKRIELVRALMARPRLLLLDEPAAGLNPAETDALGERLQALRRAHDVTLLLVEHDMNFVGALCERLVVLNFGRKIADGRPEEVRAHPLVREAYLGVDPDGLETAFVEEEQHRVA